MTIPRRLKAVIKRNNGRYHPIANELGINVFWVYNYIAKGREPRNPDIRKRLFLPPLRKPRAANGQKQELPHHIQWWRSLDKETRSDIVRRAWTQLNSLHPPEKP